PVGMADVAGYEKWVVSPPVPDSVTDIGLRGEPNLEVIIGLKPDLILLTDEGIGMARQAERIAPVVHFNAFAKGQDNIAQGRENYLMLARLFGKEDTARANLAAMDARLAKQAEQIKTHFGGEVPKVTLVRFVDAKRAVVYGKNGPPHAALTALGLKSAIEIPSSRWGLAYKRIRKLAEASSGKVLYFEPFDQKAELFETALWQAMPFVKSGSFEALPPLWSYGGPLTVGQIGDAITEVLLK
ncbi:ABC transporter substrate-binding protein, partial [Leisingera sp. ANG-Vp]|uniref:ABC transporter substrate-binding protein n=1 Tax=Leisingera sp. ANG-Vp TaxID=1577896 RepID=UPI00057EC0EE